MRSAAELLTQYAAYHRDRRNIVTHFIGIPMIVLALVILLSRPVLATWDGIVVTPALVLAAVLALYYFWLDWRLALALNAFFVGCLAVAVPIAQSATAVWATTGVGLFVVGWIFQFVGHHYEGRKPAFVDDLIGLIVGPLFVTAEAAFSLGLRKPLQQQIESVVGPTRIRGEAAAATSSH